MGWDQPARGAGRVSEGRQAAAAQEDPPIGGSGVSITAPARDPPPHLADGSLKESDEGAEGNGSDSDSSEGQWDAVVGWDQPAAGAGRASEERKDALEDLPPGGAVSEDPCGSSQREHLEMMANKNMTRSKEWNLPCYTETTVRGDVLVEAGLFLEARIVDYYHHGATVDTRKLIIDWLIRMGAAVVVDTAAEQERLPCP